MKPHKHAELIKAWADGAEIEVKHTANQLWWDAKPPLWDLDYKYRIKPVEKKKVIRYLWAYGTETYRYQGSTFLSDAEARMQGFTKRLDWSATEFEE